MLLQVILLDVRWALLTLFSIASFINVDYLIITVFAGVFYVFVRILFLLLFVYIFFDAFREGSRDHCQRLLATLSISRYFINMARL